MMEINNLLYNQCSFPPTHTHTVSGACGTRHHSCTCNFLIPNNAMTLILIMQQKIQLCSLPFIAMVSDSLIQTALILLMCPTFISILQIPL